MKTLLCLATAVAMMVLNYTTFSYTRSQTGGGSSGYNKVTQTDTTTDCDGPGYASCPEKQPWQRLTDVLTLDGYPVNVLFKEIEEIVYDDMRNIGVPDRRWEDIPRQFLKRSIDTEKLNLLQSIMESYGYNIQKLIEEMVVNSRWQNLEDIFPEEWKLIRKVQEAEEVYNDILLDVKDVPIKWEYEGVITPSYYYAPTKEFVIKVVKWQAVTLKDYRWELNVIVVPEEEYLEYLLNVKK